MKLTLNELTYVYDVAKETRERLISWGTLENEEGEKNFNISNLSDYDKHTYKIVCQIIDKLEKVEI